MEWHRLKTWNSKTHNYSCLCGQQYDDDIVMLLHLWTNALNSEGITYNQILEMFIGKTISTARYKQLTTEYFADPNEPVMHWRSGK